MKVFYDLALIDFDLDISNADAVIEAARVALEDATTLVTDTA